MKKGKFIVLEGLDGCGKSTISTFIQKTFKADLLNALPKGIKPWLEIVGNTKLPEATFSYFTLCNLLKSQEIESIILSILTKFTKQQNFFEPFLSLHVLLQLDEEKC